MTHRTVACYTKMYIVLKAAIGAVRPSRIFLDMEVAAYKAFLDSQLPSLISLFIFV